MSEKKDRIPELFGSMVFNEEAMAQYVSRNAMTAWQRCLQNGQPLPIDVANDIATYPELRLLGIDLTIRTMWTIYLSGVKSI